MRGSSPLHGVLLRGRRLPRDLPLLRGPDVGEGGRVRQLPAAAASPADPQGVERRTRHPWCWCWCWCCPADPVFFFFLRSLGGCRGWSRGRVGCPLSMVLLLSLPPVQAGWNTLMSTPLECFRPPVQRRQETSRKNRTVCFVSTSSLFSRASSRRGTARGQRGGQREIACARSASVHSLACFLRAAWACRAFRPPC